MIPGRSFHLFVYGTLKRAGCRHRLLADQRFLGEAWSFPRYALHDLGPYPGLVHAPADGQVIHGELFEVDGGLLPLLDAVEDAPELFRLEAIALPGRSETTWAYFYQQDVRDRPRIASGTWMDPKPHRGRT